MNTWIKVFTSRDRFEANMLKGVLESSDIPVQLLNKQDSNYLFFGEIELMVPANFAETALMLIEEAKFKA